MVAFKVGGEEGNYHATLSDGQNTLGIKFVDARGDPDYTSIRRLPIPQNALKIQQGSEKYSDTEPPYVTIARDNWVGGRGLDDANQLSRAIVT